MRPRAQVEGELIAIVDVFHQLLRTAYRRRRPHEDGLNDWLEWAVRAGLLTRDEVSTYLGALRVRMAMMSFGEHDRTLESLMARITDVHDIADRFHQLEQGMTESDGVVITFDGRRQKRP